MYEKSSSKLVQVIRGHVGGPCVCAPCPLQHAVEQGGRIGLTILDLPVDVPDHVCHAVPPFNGQLRAQLRQLRSHPTLHLQAHFDRVDAGPATKLRSGPQDNPVPSRLDCVAIDLEPDGRPPLAIR